MLPPGIRVYPDAVRARPASRCGRSMARSDALVCPSVFSRNRGVQVPSDTNRWPVDSPESAMPIRPGCGDSPQGRARRPSRPAPARCLRFSSCSCPPKPEADPSGCVLRLTGPAVTCTGPSPHCLSSSTGPGGPTCSPSRRAPASRPPGPHGPGRPGRHPHPCPADRHHHGRHPGRPPAATPVGTAPDSIQLSTWEWEGGQDGHQIAAAGHIRCDLAAAPGS